MLFDIQMTYSNLFSCMACVILMAEINPRRSRKPTTYRMPADIETKVTKILDSGEFDNLAAIYSTAIRYWLDNRGKNTLTKEWLLSKEGKEMIQGIMRSVSEE